MARGTKITGIPAVPAQPSAEHYQYQSALKQGVERLNTITTEIRSQLDTTMRFTEGHVYTSDPIDAGQAFLPDPANGNLQRVMNNGAHTLSPPTKNCEITLLYYNTTTAGAITVTGFSKVIGTSAPPSNTTTSALYFMARITVIESHSLLEWVPL